MLFLLLCCCVCGFDLLTGAIAVWQVERHLRKLDQEVAKFKMELEADNAGITEVLEKRAYHSCFIAYYKRVMFLD